MLLHLLEVGIILIQEDIIILRPLLIIVVGITHHPQVVIGDHLEADMVHHLHVMVDHGLTILQHPLVMVEVAIIIVIDFLTMCSFHMFKDNFDFFDTKLTFQ